jgi:hypothetical protein
VTLIEGSTVGYKRLHRFAPVTAERLRITVTEALGTATISEFQAFNSQE